MMQRGNAASGAGLICTFLAGPAGGSRLLHHPGGPVIMLRRILTRSVTTAESDAWLAEVASGVAGLAVMGIGMHRVFTLELDEPGRLLGLAVAMLLGLAIIGIGLVGGIKARLSTSAPRT
jgi:hypothetical protein